MGERVAEAARSGTAVETFAVADEQLLGGEGAERVAWGREPEQKVHARVVPRRSVEAVRADRLGDDERPLRLPPEGHLAPALRPPHRDHGERAVGERIRDDEVRHAERRGDRRAVAVVAVEELEHGDRLAEGPGPLERRLVSDGVDEPDPAVARQDVRGTGRRLVDDPREALGTAVVAEADLHVPSVRRATLDRRP